MSDLFLLVGEPYNDDKGENAGAAHLYNARTGRYLRKLTAKDGAASNEFGISVALSGNLALVGASGNGGTKGSAYVFNARSGKQLAKLTATDGGVGNAFGYSVTLSGSLALVGAFGDDSDKGSAYLFNARSGGGHLIKLTASDGATGDRFGSSVALCDDLALVGAPEDDDKGNNSGSAFVFDTRTGGQIAKLTATDGALFDQFGSSVALSGNLALVGAPGDDSAKGSAYLFNARFGGDHLIKLTAPDGTAGDFFGSSVALSGNLALVGAPWDNGLKGSVHVFDARSGAYLTQLTAPDGEMDDHFGRSVALSGNLVLAGKPDEEADDFGAAYFFRPLAAPLPLTRIAAKGSPGAVDAAFNAFPQAFINPDGEAFLHATLSGPGSSGGRNQGVWNTLSGSLDLALRLKDTDLGASRQAAKILNTWSHDSHNALIHITLTGPGVTSGSNQALFRDDGATLLQIARTGEDPGALFGGGLPQSFLQIAQTGTFWSRAALNTRLKKNAGSVTAANDSAIFFINHSGAPVGQVFREGVTAASTGGTLGQLFSRVAESRGSGSFGFGAAVIPASGPARQSVFSQPHTNATAMVKAVQGGDAPGTGAAQYRAFHGESISSIGWLVWRASLRGPGVTSKNNEGLWHENGHLLAARKGQQPDPAERPGVKISRILQFWPTNIPNQVVMLVKLSGPKITGARDLALCLWDQPNPNVLQILLQEGQFVEGADAPAIRVIQRVDVDPLVGRYAVLCSLTGAAARNQALFTGRTDIGNSTTEKVKRLPGMKLRKGTLHTLSVSDTARIRSLSLTPVTDKTGAGGKGLGQVINLNGAMTLTLEFDNKAREVRSGTP